MQREIEARVPRCSWCGDDPAYVRYHDDEWGVPVHDDRQLFEMLILEGAQAGLSWITILRKRPAYRKAFDRFDARKIARYDAGKKRALMADAGIVRNRLKIDAAVVNARAFLAAQKEFGSFDAYIWQFVGGRPIKNRRTGHGDIPPRTPASDAMSKDLRKRGHPALSTQHPAPSTQHPAPSTSTTLHNSDPRFSVKGSSCST